MLNIKSRRILAWIAGLTTCPSCGHDDQTYLISYDCTCTNENCACRWERELHAARVRLTESEVVLLMTPLNSDPDTQEAAEREFLDAYRAFLALAERS